MHGGMFKPTRRDTKAKSSGMGERRLAAKSKIQNRRRAILRVKRDRKFNFPSSEGDNIDLREILFDIEII